MATKWVQMTKARLKANPLHWDGPVDKPTKCAACGGKGKRVTLAGVCNYGSEFNHCYTCGFKYT